MRGIFWLFVLVFVLGVIYPPIAAAVASGVMTAAFVIWFLALDRLAKGLTGF